MSWDSKNMKANIFKAVYNQPQSAAKECGGKRANCRLTSYGASSWRYNVRWILSHTQEFIRWNEQEREGIARKSVLPRYPNRTTAIISGTLRKSILITPARGTIAYMKYRSRHWNFFTLSSYCPLGIHRLHLEWGNYLGSVCSEIDERCAPRRHLLIFSFSGSSPACHSCCGGLVPF